MKKVIKFSQLSPSRKMLIRLCQTLNYGSILNVGVTNGEVNLDPETEALLNVRLDEEAGARAEMELPDFILSTEMCRLLTQIDSVKDGTIEEIVVHAGVPRRVIFRRPISQALSNGK